MYFPWWVWLINGFKRLKLLFQLSAINVNNLTHIQVKLQKYLIKGLLSYSLLIFKTKSLKCSRIILQISIFCFYQLSEKLNCIIYIYINHNVKHSLLIQIASLVYKKLSIMLGGGGGIPNISKATQSMKKRNILYHCDWSWSQGYRHCC